MKTFKQFLSEAEFSNPDFAQRNAMNKKVTLKDGTTGTLVFDYQNGSYAFKETGNRYATNIIKKDEMEDENG